MKRLWRHCLDDENEESQDDIQEEFIAILEKIDGEDPLLCGCNKIVVSHQMTKRFKEDLKEAGFDDVKDISYTKEGKDLCIFDLVYCFAKITKFLGKSCQGYELITSYDENTFTAKITHV